MSKFEWDTAKAVSNFAKHGVAFELARQAFADPFAVERVDTAHPGEDRIVRIARAGTSLLTVAYAEHGEVVRIVSARRATRSERDEFYRENSAG
ncbi:MAG: BrnT family toxin [Alphaproteobacteria bacterium]|nr:BrnT family toxin [Alphaproteobacteria bacterium]